MAALVGNLTSVENPFQWTIFFARQPEPDLEFTEEELDQTITTKTRGPVTPRKKSGGGRPLLWILFLALVTGIAYVAMEPEMVTEWLGPYLGESLSPTAAMKPAIPVPTPQTTPRPSEPAPAPVSPDASAPSAVAPATPAMTLPPAAAKPATQAAPPPAPMFGEGQRVTVTVDPAAPGGNISLYADSTGNKPGPLIRAGATLTVMDGDLQPDGWMYAVRTDEGVKGWVSEKRLRLKF